MKCNRRFQGLPSRRSPSLPIWYGPHWTQLLFFIFDRLGGNFQLSSYWQKVNVLVVFFSFCFAWWRFVIAIICSNVTILTPITGNWWKFPKMEVVQIRSDIWPIIWLQNIKWSSGRVEWFPGDGGTQGRKKPVLNAVKAGGSFETLCLFILKANPTGAPNEYFSENEPLTTENENLGAFKAFSSAFLCCWKEFICSSLPAG